MAQLHELTAREQSFLLRTGALRPSELVEHYLDRIEKHGASIGAFIVVDADGARERAAALEATGHPRSTPTGSFSLSDPEHFRIESPGENPDQVLWGLPLADKDLEARAGLPTSYGSRVFAGVVSEQSDEIVEAVDAAGAISLGKTNTPEFGQHGFTDNLVAGPARNPWDRSLHAGGSSGGAAAAVAARLLPFAPGSDGGGSIRIPAAATGLVGLKPSRGRVPGGSGIGSVGGLGVAGPIARTVGDAALLLEGMIGTPAPARFALRAPELEPGALLRAADTPHGRFRIGILRDSPWADEYAIGLDESGELAFSEGIEHLRALGHVLTEIPLERSAGYSNAFRTLWRSFPAAAPLTEGAEALLEPVTAQLRESGKEVRATDLIAALGFFARFERDVIDQFSGFDAILTPALGQSPRALNWYSQTDPDLSFEQQVLYSPWTSFVNATGLPGIALPVSQDARGLPAAIQLIGRPGDELTLLSLGAQLENRIGWHERVPADFA
ncbi:amidase [Mycetocola saprophilus]|uniref:amidase n=1 Tax=Mycetocola saprophilus TaxID=76636 RepID=UPI0004C0205D|nr:amidase [Mycetocola saprophilus]